ncbi:ATP-binding cassette domain-containing protein [Streptomyces niger]|uniref:ATP-binding cassette domain-containing protein n=1 Tax=Streptomyces niger TaxID=66373 RepID=UPI000A5CF54F|nr:ATP-binding cassette domain-containing protein [Streptomyces niger]
MIQAVGLTSEARRGLPPAVDDLTFEAPAGQVTVLLGARGSGKTTALRLMLRMERGRGITLFRGRPLHRLPNPAREVGVLLGDVPGHPSRTARSHLRMLTAAAGVPPDRAEDVLEAVGLSDLGEQRLGEFSRGMDRRLGMAAALLGDPHTLLLDEPADEVSPREAAWLYGLLRGFAAQGGSVLVTASDAKAAARLGDRIVTIEDGRLLADQEAADFTHARLRPRVSVRSPHADRLAAILVDEWQRADPAVDPRAEQALEVVRETGNRIAVYGSSCALVGDTAFRHGILVHQLADEVGDAGPVIPLDRADGRTAVRPAVGHGARVAVGTVKDEGEYEKSDARYAGTPHEQVAGEPYPDVHGKGRPEGLESAEAYAEEHPEAYAESYVQEHPESYAEEHPEAYAASFAPGEAAEANTKRSAEAASGADGRPRNGEPERERSGEPEREHPGELMRKDAGGHCALISGPGVAGTAGESPPLGDSQGAGRRVTISGRALSFADRESGSGTGSGTGSDTGGELASTLELPVVPADASQAPQSGKPADGRWSGEPAGGPEAPLRTRSRPRAQAHTRNHTHHHPHPHPHSPAPDVAAPRAPRHASSSRSSRSSRGRIQPSRLMLPRLPAPGPAWPVRYEMRRTASDRTALGVGLCVLVVSLVLACVLARVGDVSAARALAGWPGRLPFPPAAVGAGLIGALAFGQEFRYPALAPEQGSVPRRLRLLGAKLLISAVSVLVLAVVSAFLNTVTVGYVFGVRALPSVADWPLLSLGWGALMVGSAWAGLLAAGIFRSTAMGLAAVLAVPVAVVPLLEGLLSDSTTRSAIGFPARVQATAAVRWPSRGGELTDAVWRLAAQPVVGAMGLSLAALLCAYALTALRRRAR